MELKKASRGLGGSGGAFPLPEHHRGVVGTRVDGAFTQVEGVDKNVGVGHRRGKFKVGIGDGAMGVVP